MGAPFPGEREPELRGAQGAVGGEGQGVGRSPSRCGKVRGGFASHRFISVRLLSLCFSPSACPSDSWASSQIPLPGSPRLILLILRSRGRRQFRQQLRREAFSFHLCEVVF